MKMHPRMLWPTYTMSALVVWSSVVSILNRANDPMWVGPMSDSKANYDIVSVLIASYAVIVAYGVFRRREWGRVFGISLSVIVLYAFVGTRLLAPVLTDGAVPIELGWEAFAMGFLAMVCIVTLARQSFRSH